MPAPRYNIYAMGTQNGVKKKYENPDEMELLINGYFDGCFSQMVKLNSFGQPIKNPRYISPEETPTLDKYITYMHTNHHPTISGLAAHLELDRHSLLNYEKKKGYEEFFTIIKKARGVIEAYVEGSLFSKDSCTGAIFNLKNNFNWVDKKEVDMSGKFVDRIEITMEDWEDDGEYEYDDGIDE